MRYLPKWARALICVLSMPLGPLAYLTLGRAPPVEHLRPALVALVATVVLLWLAASRFQRREM